MEERLGGNGRQLDDEAGTKWRNVWEEMGGSLTMRLGQNGGTFGRKWRQLAPSSSGL